MQLIQKLLELVSLRQLDNRTEYFVFRRNYLKYFFHSWFFKHTPLEFPVISRSSLESSWFLYQFRNQPTQLKVGLSQILRVDTLKPP